MVLATKEEEEKIKWKCIAACLPVQKVTVTKIHEMT